MKDKKQLASYSIILAGLLILLWGLLHVFIITVVNDELIASNVDNNIKSLITLSYLGIVVMISISGLIVIYSAIVGIKNGAKWAYFICFSQGLLYSFVTILLVSFQPQVSVLGFAADFVLILAILTDLAISVLILVPLIIFRKDLIES